MHDWFAAFRRAPDGPNLEQTEQGVPNEGVAGCGTCGAIEIIEEKVPHPVDAMRVAECGNKGSERDLPHVPHPTIETGVAAKVLQNQAWLTSHTCHTPKCNDLPSEAVDQVSGLPSVEEFEERAASIADGCGLTQVEASEKAAIEFGFNNSEDYRFSTLFLWRYRLGLLPASTSTYGCQFIETCHSFLDGPFCLRAIEYGWTELELFGCHETAPLRRHDAKGLIPELAWSHLGSKIVAIDNERAVLETRSKSELTHWRFRRSYHEAVAIWDHALLIGD